MAEETTDSIKRVVDDLQTIRQAAGLDLPFGKEDIWLDLLLIPLAVFFTIWSYFCGENHWLWVGAAPLAIIAIGGTAYLRARYRRSSARPTARRKEYTFQLVFGALTMSALIAFALWALHVGLPRCYVNSIGFFFLAVGVLAMSFVHPARYRYMVAAGFLFVLAVIVPVFYDRHVVTMVGGISTLFVAADAAIMVVQLRRRRATV
jgi:hypothetical protein